MTIDRIGPIDSVPNVKKSNKSTKPKRSDGADSINVSAEAKSKAEIYQATEQAKSAQEIRWDRVQEVKKKLEDPDYITDQVMDEVAERIMEQFDIS